jgi:histone H3/H4
MTIGAFNPGVLTFNPTSIEDVGDKVPENIKVYELINSEEMPIEAVHKLLKWINIKLSEKAYQRLDDALKEYFKDTQCK